MDGGWRNNMTTPGATIVSVAARVEETKTRAK